MVWSEPMLRVAARFGVSSSYMARVCTLLNVLRPERGYWAKLQSAKRRKNRHSLNHVRAIRSSGRETEPSRRGPDPSRSLPTSRLGENARYSGNFQIGIHW
jgi:hypothetical protein